MRKKSILACSVRSMCMLFAAFAYFLFVFFSFVYTGGRICVRERRMLSFNV